MNKVIRVALKQTMPTTGEPDDLILGGVDWIKDNWPVVCKEAKIKGLHFHDMRATYVTRILEAGFDRVDSLSDTAQIQSGRNVGTSS